MQQTREKELLGILENSIDWYLVLDIHPDETITVNYVNKIMFMNCEHVCANSFIKTGMNFRNCVGFNNLVDTVLQVYKTKERVNFPQYFFKCEHNGTIKKAKILDLQIYPNNGNIVICGRDLEPMIYEFRANVALLSHKLTALLEATAPKEDNVQYSISRISTNCR
jgi:hypothetical protein